MNKAAGFKELDLNETSRNVLEGVRMLRLEKQWSFAELEERLTGVGHRIPALGLRRIESGARRVDVDDLTALAAVFDVSPSRLLLHVPEQHEGRHLTGTPEDMSPLEAAAWLRDEIGLSPKDRIVFWQQHLITLERLRTDQEARMKQLGNRLKQNPTDENLLDRFLLEADQIQALTRREEQGREVLARLREQQDNFKDNFNDKDRFPSAHAKKR